MLISLLQLVVVVVAAAAVAGRFLSHLVASREPIADVNKKGANVLCTLAPLVW
jgi:hypothetical protein